MDALNAIPGVNTAVKGKKRGKAAHGPSWTLPSWLKGLIACGIGLLVVVGCFKLFTTYYYKRNKVFQVTPEEVHVLGNATVTRDYILQMFGITGPRNGYDLVTSDIMDCSACALKVLVVETVMFFFRMLVTVAPLKM